MADEPQANGAETGAEQQQLPKMQVRTQYIRDLSFENFVAQKGLAAGQSPDVKVGVKLDAKKRPDELYEVIIVMEVKAEAGEDTLFILELNYGGIFHVENVPDAQLHPYLMIECPRMLFPFVRRIISDTTRDGGFPPVNVDTLDFVALYRNELTRRQAEQAKQAEPSGTA